MSCKERVNMLAGRQFAACSHVETLITSLSDLGQIAGSADLGLFFFLLFRAQQRETLLKRNGEGDERVAGVVFVDPALDFGKPVYVMSMYSVFSVFKKRRRRMERTTCSSCG
jgi:hypothetical protein